MYNTPAMPNARLLRWPARLDDAKALQESLRGRLRLSGGPRKVRLVAGADLAVSQDGRTAWAGVVVASLPDLVPVESVWVRGPVTVPYVPGYLSFREGPHLLRAFAKLTSRPDLLLFDGQGIAHPRGFGLASHLGVLLGRPSIGCAKSRLVGEHDEPGTERGAWAPLRMDGRTVGAVVRSRGGVRPLYVSVGHLISLRPAIRWTLACCRFRIPEPIRLAERLVNRVKKESLHAHAVG